MHVKPYLLLGWTKNVFSKRNYVFLTLFALLSFINFSYATDYYFSTSSGNDSRSASEAQNPATPWRSIDKLNSISGSLQGGDRIMFKSGDTFYGTIKISRSGASGAPIQFTSFGSGPKPIITSLVRVTNWVAVGGGLYQADLSSYNVNKMQILLINDQIREIGRFPNSGDSNGGYLTITNANSFSSISTQGGAPYSGSGGEVVIRKNNWIIDRHTIDYIGGSTINYRATGSGYGPQKNYGYFLQNHPSLLDRSGEWAYDPVSKQLTVNLSGLDVSNTNVSVSTLDNLVVNNSYTNNLSFSNLNFRGANSHIINISRSENVSVKNSDFSFAGESAIYSAEVKGLVIENNQINYSLNSGIFMPYSTPSAIVRGNSINNTMPFQGMAKSSDTAGVGIFLGSNGDRSVIEKNNLINTGFNAIHFGGNYTKIVNNYIDNFCLFKQDGGGIYTNSDGLSNSNNIGREITGNIVLNGKGTKFGTVEDVNMAEGIYIDDNSAGITVSKNTVAFMSGKSIYLHNANNITISENLFYQSRTQIDLTHSSMGGPIRNVNVFQNQFSSVDQTDKVYSVYSTENDIGSVGSFYTNYFLDPFNHDFFIKTKGSNDGPMGVARNLKNWAASYGYDGNAIRPELNLPTYKINSSTPIKTSDFSSSSSILAGVYGAVSQLSGGMLRVNPNSSSSATLYIHSGAIQPGEKILVEFDMQGTPANNPVEVFLEGTYNTDNGKGNGRVSTTSSIKSHQILLSSSVSKSNESVVIRIPSTASEVFLDNVKISKVTTQDIDKESYMFFAHNPTSVPVQRGLSGTYKNAKNETFSGSVTIPPYGSVLLARVSGEITAGPDQSPTVTLANPDNNQIFVKGVNPVELVANAQDPEGEIKQVEFYNWGTLVATVTDAPYTFNWSAIQLGEYQVYAKVTDEQNQTATSNTVRFSVRDEAPTNPNTPSTSNFEAKMLSPINNSTFALGSQEVILRTNAHESGLNIQRIEFFNWGFPLVSGSGANYNFNWSKIEVDRYNVYAKITDDKGVVYTTEPIRFRVTAPEAKLSINVAEPFNNQNFTWGEQTVKLKANVSSTAGIRSVQFYNWGAPLVSVNEAPYEFDWTRIQVGEYRVHAVITDVNGMTSTSNTVRFRVSWPLARITEAGASADSNSSVKVEMVQPTENQEFQIGSDSVVLEAKTSDKVSKVEFFNWYLPVDSASEGETSFNWEDIDAGDYLVYAKVTDIYGNTSESEPVRFTVVDPEVNTANSSARLEGTDEVTRYGIEMGPNPTSSHLNIFLADYPKDYEGVVSILNVQGVEMVNSEFNTNQETLTLDLTFLKSGVYIVRLNFGNGVSQSKKLIKL